MSNANGPGVNHVAPRHQVWFLAIGLAIAALGGVGVHDFFVDPDRRLLNSGPLMFLGPTVLSIGLLTVGLTAIRTPRRRRRASFILITAGIAALVFPAVLAVLEMISPRPFGLNDEGGLLVFFVLVLLAGPAIACIAAGTVTASSSRRQPPDA